MDLFVDTIVAFLNEGFQAAGLADDLPLVTAQMVEKPPTAEVGDYAFPCFALARALRKAPALIAGELAAKLHPATDTQPLLTAVEAVGPYLNFRVAGDIMAAHTLKGIQDKSYFSALSTEPGKKVMVEYSQPNTHKAFHVGHMRNVALGDALVRILEYCGHQVVAANYIGDSGAHIAKCLWYHLNHQEQKPPQGEDRAALGEWLGSLYSAATALLDAASPAERKAYDASIGEVLEEIDRGNQAATPKKTTPQNSEIYQLYLKTRQWSLASFDEIYRWLGARFDRVFCESEMDAHTRPILEDGVAKGVFKSSQGAIGADLEAHGMGFFMVLKGDGNTLYSTKDLALAQIKFRDFGIKESIYVVGAEQTLHFRQVFKTLELLGYKQAADCHHLPYGLVMLPDGKMSSRAGNVILFSTLRNELNAYIETHYMQGYQRQWKPAEISETIQRIAVAGIRYGMVKQDPAKSIVFNLEDWLVSEGDTGTYLCYAYTRIQSVLRKMAQAPDAVADYTLLTQDPEKRLVRELYDFNRVVRMAGETLRPNLVANALFQIAKEFSRTYATSPVKQAENPALAAARLSLFFATGEVLKRGLGLLGITPPERM